MAPLLWAVSLLTGMSGNPFLEGTLTGSAAGGMGGGLVRGLGAMHGAEIGAGAGYGNPYTDAAAAILRLDASKLDAFHALLREGYLPANFFGSTAPPIRVRVLMFSVPQPASLVINGVPTTFATTIDLYMLPDDIRNSTLEHAGYAPCQVADAILPGLQQPAGGEALMVRCTLTRLEVPR